MNNTIRNIAYLFVFICLFSATLAGQKENLTSGPVAIIDSQHYSHVFADSRKYRIFLPPNYNTDLKKRYSVIYFFHGWSQRYFGGMADSYADYDKGEDNDGDNIANFVAKRDVIVIKLDGFNQFSSEALNLTPYNIGAVSTFRQFPIYFQEFVNYTDETYRTIPDRNHRAISGLSMGGFMTFWVGGKYPDLISGLGNFCGSLEMPVGPPEFPVTYNHMDMYDNYDGVNVRFHFGTRDRLRYYHYDFLKVWPQVMDNFQYKVYEAGHVTCGLGDMFEFLYENFENPPEKPANWNHIDVYPNFEIWDYKISSDRTQSGFTVLEQVNARGFKSSVRTFLPDGELMSQVNMAIKTPPIYRPNQPYIVIDQDLSKNQFSADTLISDEQGILLIKLNGNQHQVGINALNDLPNISISSVKVKNMNWAMTGEDVVVSLSLINKGLQDANNLRLTLTSLAQYINVKDEQAKVTVLEAGNLNQASSEFTVFCEVDTVEIARFRLTVEDQAQHKWVEDFELKFRKVASPIGDFIIADGGSYTVVHGGVDSVTGILGAGNGDGQANPGESIVLLVPYQGKYYRTNAYSSDSDLNPQGFTDRVIDSWANYDHIGGGPMYTIPIISSTCPDGKMIDFWVEYWLPNSPEHIIKRGTIQIKVVGDMDKTPPTFKWLQVLNDKVIAIKSNDGAGIENVRLKLIPDKEASTQRYLKWDTPEAFSVIMLDDGTKGDKCAGDDVFSVIIKNRPSYFYRAEIMMRDVFGNENTMVYEKPFFLQDTN